VVVKDVVLGPTIEESAAGCGCEIRENARASTLESIVSEAPRRTRRGLFVRTHRLQGRPAKTIIFFETRYPGPLFEFANAAAGPLQRQLMIS